MKVLFAAAEAAPFFKTGGLGDVASALPKELKRQGVDIRVVLPLYSQMPQQYQEQLEDVLDFRIQLGFKNVYVGIKTLTLDDIQYYFIDNLAYFDRSSLYGQEDDGERFGFFSLAVIEMMEKIDFIPDIVHVNDWQVAMVPVMLVDRYHWVEKYRKIRKVLTIHNIRFQGWYDSSILHSVFNTTMSTFHGNGVEQNNMVNFLKGGINFSDIVTTVSPSYAKEIQTAEFGEGMDGTLRNNNWKIHGIINGIDYGLNDPATDPALVAQYDVNTYKAGKAANKMALQERAGLKVDAKLPLLGIVTRLTDQKGMQLVQEKAEELLNTRDVQVVVLGTGEAQFEDSFRYFEWKYPEQFSAIIDFDVALAQLIYAGSDIFLMPSAFEPCGLSQMIAMRYGTLPLVHETGGLKDTVQAYNKYSGTGNGFSFAGFSGYDFLGVIYNALEVYHDDQAAWDKLVTQAMNTDFRWDKPAAEYLALYASLVEE